MMRMKVLASIAAVGVLVGSFATITDAAYFPDVDFKRAALDIKVLYNARQINSDAKPENVKGTIFVPFTAVGKALNAQMALSTNGKEITFAKGSKKVKVTIGSRRAVVNGEAVTLNAAPYIKNSRTMVPTRFISEQLGEKVEWDPIIQFVWIGNKNVPQVTDLDKQLEDIGDYKDYFPAGKYTTYITKAGTVEEFKKVRTITMYQLPFAIGKETYYRMDKTYSADGSEAIQTIVYDKADLGRAYYLLDKGKETRVRIDSKMTMVNGKTFHYNKVASEIDVTFFNDKNYKSLKLNTIDYIGIDAAGTVTDSLLLIKNDFK